MSFQEAVRMAVASLWEHKLQSFLTVLGILIGVSSVIAVVAITQGLDAYIADRVLQLGSKAFYVQKTPDIILSQEQWAEMQKRKDVTLREMEEVRRACESCLEVGAAVATSRSVKYGRVTRNNVRVEGITANIPQIGSVRDLAAGRHLVEHDVDTTMLVAVIGTDLRDAFFGEQEPLNKIISVEGYTVKVVGVAEPKGRIFGESQDNFVWIPITTFRRLFGTRSPVVIHVEARSMDMLEPAQDEARTILRGRRHLEYGQADDFEIETGESLLSLWRGATQGIYAVTVVVTAISLAVAGVVIMNIMLVSVTERITEIGVRKALGATRSDIVRQFLVESVVLSACGGVLGLLAAVGLSWALAFLLGSLMSADFSAPVRGWAVILALVTSGLVGLAAGLYPASRAAALDPVAALRSE